MVCWFSKYTFVYCINEVKHRELGFCYLNFKKSGEFPMEEKCLEEMLYVLR